MSRKRKPSLRKNLKLQVHWSSKQKKPWILSKRKISRSQSHLPIHQEVFPKFLRPPSGFSPDSTKKSMLINRRSQKPSIGKPPRNWWRILKHSWLLCSASKKSSIIMNFRQPTLQSSREIIFLMLNSTLRLLRINQKQQLVFALGSSTS